MLFSSPIYLFPLLFLQLIPLLFLLLSSSASVYGRSYIYQQTSGRGSIGNSQPTTSASSTYGKYERIPVYVASASSPASSYGVAVSAPASAAPAAPAPISAGPGIATSSMYFQLSPQAALPSSAGGLQYQQGISYLPTLAAHQLPSAAVATGAASPNYEVLDGRYDGGDYSAGGGDDGRDDYTNAPGNGGDGGGGGGEGEYGGVVNERLPASEEYGAGAAAQANFEKVGKGSSVGASYGGESAVSSGAGGGDEYGSSGSVGSSSAGSYETAAAPVAPVAVPVAAPLPSVAYAAPAQPAQILYQQIGCGGGSGYPCQAAAAKYPGGPPGGPHHRLSWFGSKTTAVPVALAPAPAVAGVAIKSHHGGLGKLLDLKKFEDLLPEFPSKGGHLEGILSVLAGLDLPSLTLNMPKKLPTGPLPKPGALFDQLLAATSDILPHIRLPAPSGPPVIASGVVAKAPAAVAVAPAPVPVVAPAPAVAVAHHPAPVAITKTIGHEGHGITGLGDLLSKLTKFEIVKRVKLPASKVALLHRPVHGAAPVAVAAAATSVHPVAVPHPQRLPPRKIVTAYPLQKGPYTGHVVIEDFPFGRQQYGPFDEGGEATLGCDQLDGAVAAGHPAPAPGPVAKY
ncbi:hypothetical protein TYRP_005588 [Tyrophagus putrescentiae]|nr:hypothetical protein TYRP_005588 [Tyrophagus putrescentiae]